MRLPRRTRRRLLVRKLYPSARLPLPGDSIDPRETLLRRAVPPDQWDREIDRPTIGALSVKKNEQGASVYALMLMRTRGLGPRSLLSEKPRHGVFSFPAGHSALEPCELVHDPEPEQATRPENFAHSLIKIGALDKRRWQVVRQTLIDSSRIEISPPMI